MRLNDLTVGADEVTTLRQRIGELESDLAGQRKRSDRQMRLAAEVHRSLLPLPVHSDRLDVDIRYQPVDGVGGDYCQVRRLDGDVCYITVCDVTGHGIAAALLATRVSSEVRNSVLSGKSPAAIVEGLNAFVCEHLPDVGLFLTFAVLRIDVARGELIWSGAGHPSPILVRKDRTTMRLRSQNLMIGVRAQSLAAEPEHAVALAAGDRVLVYTDGMTEVFDDTGAELGEQGLARLASNAMSEDVFGMADRILSEVEKLQEGPTTDDRTLIVVGVK